MRTHYIQSGDSLTPLGATLKQYNSSGVLAAIDLSGLTVKVTIVDKQGATVVAETTSGVTVAIATEGRVQYDFPNGSNALPDGTYYLYFRVYSGSERDTFPVRSKEMQIVVESN